MLIVILIFIATYIFGIFYTYHLFRNWCDQRNWFHLHTEGRQFMCGISALFWPIGYLCMAGAWFGYKDWRGK